MLIRNGRAGEVIYLKGSGYLRVRSIHADFVELGFEDADGTLAVIPLGNSEPPQKKLDKPPRNRFT